MILVDTHAHLDFPQFADDLSQTLDRAREAGVVAIVNAGVSLETSECAIALAEHFPEVHAAVGVHPHDARDLDADALRRLEELAAHPRVVAVGETGLDYVRKLSSPEAQRRAFAAHARLAVRLGLPVIVHNRSADEDVLAVLEEVAAGGTLRGVMHCFSGSAETARRAVELGLYIAVGGVVTFPSAGALREAVKEVPFDRLVLETDAPYLAPQPVRGKRNEPAYIAHTANAVAALLEQDADDVARIASNNAAELFGFAL